MLWDCVHPQIFIAYNDKLCLTYVYVKYSVDGKHVTSIGETNLLSDQIPLMLYDGDLSLCTNTGKLSSVILTTHLNVPGADLNSQFDVLIKLRKFGDAWEICKILNDITVWTKLGNAAISDLDISFGLLLLHYIIKMYIKFATNFNNVIIFSLFIC